MRLVVVFVPLDGLYSDSIAALLAGSPMFGFPIRELVVAGPFAPGWSVRLRPAAGVGLGTVPLAAAGGTPGAGTAAMTGTDRV